MRKRKRRRKQRIQFCTHVASILIIATVTMCTMNNETADVSCVTTATTVSAEKSEVTPIKEENVKEMSSTEVQETKEPTEDDYLLAKIAMAEAEGESLYTKTLVILTVLNRMQSKDFPNTIEEVILEEQNGVYQFSPVIPGGRWWTTEPNEDCWEAVRMVREMTHDYSSGALYFEACKDKDNWHSRNLDFVLESDGVRFYK